MNGRVSIRWQLVSLLILMPFVLGNLTSCTTPEDSEISLYERLGGVYNIATVVDDFIERVLVNDTLNANPAISEARERVPKAGLKFHLTALICQHAGGKERYTGRTMKESHQHLNITETEWQAMLTDFKEALDKFWVPEIEQHELFVIVESTKADIVQN